MLVNITEYFIESGREWRIGENPDVPREVAARWIADGKATADTDGERGSQSSVSGAGSTASTQFLAAIKNNQRDVAVLVCGDSTAAGVQTWPYYMSQRFAAMYPTHTVQFVQFGSGTSYNAPITISTGSGGNKIIVYSATRSGSDQTLWLSGAIFASAFSSLAVSPVDLIMVCLGFNVSTPYAYETGPAVGWLVDDLLSVHPGAGVMIVAQNPGRPGDGSSAGYAVKTRGIAEYAQRRGWQVIDVYGEMLRANLPVSAWSDAVHPTQATQAGIYTDTVMSAFIMAAAHSASYSAYADRKRNMLLNSDFNVFSGESPDYWTLFNCSAAKNVTIYESSNSYSVELTSTLGGDAQMIQTLTPQTLNACKGRFVTLAARVYLDGTTGGIGQSSMTTNEYLDQAIKITGSTNRWVWLVTSRFVPLTSTSLTIRLYVTKTTAAAGKTMLVDRVGLFLGLLPADPA